jgi:outer membrane protein assembly factor BamB
MATTTASKKERATSSETALGRLFVLDLSGDRIFTVDPDGSNKTVIVSGCRFPDGIVVDAERGHIYWTNMGAPKMNDGSIERADFDGQNRQTIVPEGVTFTPKQLHFNRDDGKLYWSDREGMRVMRVNLDGSHIETLVDTSRGDARPGRDATKWCVGITVDPQGGQIYWTQKGPDNANQGKLCRASIDIPAGESATNRSDIEVFFDHLPEPIDLELNIENRVLYWTDRGDPPRGNTVNRASVDAKPETPEIVFSHLMEGIGITLDVAGGRMFMADFAGSVYSANLDGSEKRNFLYAQGNLTGIAYAQIPSKEN